MRKNSYYFIVKFFLLFAFLLYLASLIFYITLPNAMYTRFSLFFFSACLVLTVISMPLANKKFSYLSFLYAIFMVLTLFTIDFLRLFELISTIELNKLYYPLLYLGLFALFFIGIINFKDALFPIYFKLQFLLDLSLALFLSVILVAFLLNKYIYSGFFISLNLDGKIYILIFLMSLFLLFLGGISPFYFQIPQALYPKTILRLAIIVYSLGNILYSNYSLENSSKIIQAELLIRLALLLIGFYSLKKFDLNLSNSPTNDQPNIKTMINRTDRNYYYYSSIIFTVSILYALKIVNSILLIEYLFIIFLHYLIDKALVQFLNNRLSLTKNLNLNYKIEQIIQKRTSSLLNYNKKLKITVNTDSLTKLYNRKFFIDQLNFHINAGQNYTIFHIDLDKFKDINDIHSHIVGDNLLVAIAGKLVENLPNDYIVARIGGDEFAVMANVINNDEVSELARQIIDIIKQPIKINGRNYSLSSSIGISSYPNDAQTAEDLLKHATMATYEAKNLLTGYKYLTFSVIYSTQLKRKNNISNKLLTMDYDDCLDIYYQPKFSIDHELIGMEALLRWNCPELNLISPSEFIPIAEEIDVIIPLTQWVFKKASKQGKLWNSKFDNKLKMGINLSPILLNYTHFSSFLTDSIEKLGLDASNIEFEITENSSLLSAHYSKEYFNKMKELGFLISIDDFGTGYSSLFYVKEFEIDSIKIAKELIDNILDFPKDRDAIKAIISMSKSLNITTIAEGVENKEQLEILRQIGCDQIQGFYWGRPMPSYAFTQLLEEIYEKD